MSSRKISYMLSLAFLKFIEWKNCFRLSRSRLPKEIVQKLNDLVGLACKIARAKADINFLNDCLKNDRYPRQYFKSLRRSKLRITSGNLKRIAESELHALNHELVELQSAYCLLTPVAEHLSLFCRTKFYNYCRAVTSKAACKRMKKNILSISNEEFASNFANDLDKYVTNFSKIVLNKIQKEALSVGLKFCIPLKKISTINVQTEFEGLYNQLKHLIPTSVDAASWFKSKLVDLAY